MLRIREQNDALKKEKEHLADSLADVAHQLRTPLTSITLVLSLIENTSDEKERKNLIRETEELLVRMDWLLTSLLKLSRLDAGIVVFQKEQVNINSLITAAPVSYTHLDVYKRQVITLPAPLLWLIPISSNASVFLLLFERINVSSCSKVCFGKVA